MPSLQKVFRFVAITTSDTTFTASIAPERQPEKDLAASLNHRQACGLYAFSRMAASLKCLHLVRRVECRPAVAWLTRSTFTRKAPRVTMHTFLLHEHALCHSLPASHITLILRPVHTVPLYILFIPHCLLAVSLTTASSFRCIYHTHSPAFCFVIGFARVDYSLNHHGLTTH